MEFPREERGHSRSFGAPPTAEFPLPPMLSPPPCYQCPCQHHHQLSMIRTAEVIIICLVVLDALLVLAELILDLKIIQPDKNNYAAMLLSPSQTFTQGVVDTPCLGAKGGDQEN
ncbi:hypothetical protein P7K49_020260 [Saguinus oedipus]|uniref:Uncharacterized protein n=1 Tax=Saguinus oedipus TaxID=9490 RepID=A0ABQ9V1I7_SAGOE|nr:hypothetical protein P7K49_020260 [Saguinus oedipus]